MTYEQTRRRTVLGWLARRNTPSPSGLRPLHLRIKVDAAAVQAAAARISASQLTREQDVEPRRPVTDHLCHRLTAVVDPSAITVPRGRYAVTVTLKGTRTGREPIEVEVARPGDLAAAVARHAQAHLGGREVEVTVDPKTRGGALRVSDRTIGTFSYAPVRRTP